MKAEKRPAPSPSEPGRLWCPGCQGTGQVTLAIGLNGEACGTYECGLCEGTGEIGILRAHKRVEAAKAAGR